MTLRAVFDKAVFAHPDVTAEKVILSKTWLNNKIELIKCMFLGQNLMLKPNSITKKTMELCESHYGLVVVKFWVGNFKAKMV